MGKHFHFSFVSMCVAVLLAVNCNNSSPSANAHSKHDTVPQGVQITAASIAGNFSSQTVLKADSSLLDKFFVQYSELKPFQKNIKQFYAGRGYTMAWHDSAGLIEQAGNLINRLESLDQEGISAKVPYLDELDSLSDDPSTNDPQVQSETDFLLTGLYFYFADKVWGGMDESQTRKIDWYLPRKKMEYERWLDSLLQRPNAFVSTREPVYRQYKLLLPFLNKYKELQSTGKWETIAINKSYRLGDSDAVLVQVKNRLVQVGDLEQSSGTPVFDAALEQGVKSFQHRFGMKEDGVIGKQMIAELNVPVEARIKMIEVNLERSRWVPFGMKGPYMAVNIPEFKLHIYNGDSLLWSMNVVVGKSVHKTVIFSGDLQYVVFSPYWNVPPGILKNEVLPGIRRNKNYLASHHMEWNGKSVRQKPGPWNSLGRVKFLFPNSHNIYLHDTPSKNLFNEDSRAFSHGCIRVGEPKKLAMYLLRDDASWTEQKIDAAMNSGKEQYVTLKEKVPVFIAYFTAWVDRQGKINFRKDIYSRDERLAGMMK